MYARPLVLNTHLQRTMYSNLILEARSLVDPFSSKLNHKPLQAARGLLDCQNDLKIVLTNLSFLPFFILFLLHLLLLQRSLIFESLLDLFSLSRAFCS